VKTRGKVLKPGSLLAKPFECNKKARRDGGLFVYFYFTGMRGVNRHISGSFCALE
jgi:hypothetical protein